MEPDWILLVLSITPTADFQIILPLRVSYNYNINFVDLNDILVVCSGDSTVPVYSSTYPIKYWDKVKATEVPNADHNVLLRDDEVINQILSYAIDNYDPNMSLESKKLRFKPDLSNGKALFKEIRRVLPID